MSMAMPRMPAAMVAPGAHERASVVLPTVKCSSCSDDIPLNSLGEHICQPRPPMPSLPHAHRHKHSLPRSKLSNMDIPPIVTKLASSPSPYQSHGQTQGSSQGQGHARRPSGHVREQSRGDLSSPARLAAPTLQRPNIPSALSTDAGGFSFHIGDVVPSPRVGEYPLDVPLSAVSDARGWPGREAGDRERLSGDRNSDIDRGVSPTLPDTRSGGFAGMAGVGRRAFAAAAWSVRAGVALANNSPSGWTSPGEEHAQLPVPMPMPVPSVAGSPPRRSPPSAGSALPRRSPEMRSPQNFPHSLPRTTPSPGYTPRDPAVILPKVPLATRQRSYDERPARNRDSGDGPHSARPAVRRSATSLSNREPRERDSDEPNAFFEKYKQVMGSRSEQAHASPWGAADDGDGSDDGSIAETSSLPWARSGSPDIETSPHFDQNVHLQNLHHRQLTSGSIESSTSSASGYGVRAHDELVMTPNQSWEGNHFELRKAPHESGLSASVLPASVLSPDRDLAKIQEDDEGEQLVMGAHKPKAVPRSPSITTITPPSPKPKQSPSSAPARQLDPPRMGLAVGSLSARSSPKDSEPAPRSKRTCASCGDAVGGARRFVERDGVILCEADWKKLYLPSCRRCQHPIEKSAVSSSDGQLKGKWHRSCFTCTRCDRPFEGDDFYVHDGRPWCQYHYAEENGTLCADASCGRPIEGACILAPGLAGGRDQRFHPGHLRCEHRGGASGAQNCRESMNEYYEVAGGRFCERHGAEAARRANSTGGGARAEKRRTRLVDLPGGIHHAHGASNASTGGSADRHANRI